MLAGHHSSAGAGVLHKKSFPEHESWRVLTRNVGNVTQGCIDIPENHPLGVWFQVRIGDHSAESRLVWSHHTSYPSRRPPNGQKESQFTHQVYNIKAKKTDALGRREV